MSKTIAFILMSSLVLNAARALAHNVKYESTCYASSEVIGESIMKTKQITFYRGSEYLGFGNDGLQRLISLVENDLCQMNPIKCTLGSKNNKLLASTSTVDHLLIYKPITKAAGKVEAYHKELISKGICLPYSDQ